MIELCLIFLFLRKNFWESVIFVFGVLNFLGIFCLFLLSDYINAAEYTPKYPNTNNSLSEIGFLKNLKFAFFINGAPLLIAITFFLRKHYFLPKMQPLQPEAYGLSAVVYFIKKPFSFREGHPRKRLYGLLAIGCLYLGWFFYGLSQGTLRIVKSWTAMLRRPSASAVGDVEKI